MNKEEREAANKLINTPITAENVNEPIYAFFPEKCEHQCVSANDCPLCDEYVPPKSDSREPEKLNNSQKALLAKAKDLGERLSGVCTALAESSLSSPPPDPQLVIACLEEAIELFELDDDVNTPGTDSWLWKVKSEQALIAYAEAEASPNFRQSSSPSKLGAESVQPGKQNTADKSELLPTQSPKEK